MKHIALTAIALAGLLLAGGCSGEPSAPSGAGTGSTPAAAAPAKAAATDKPNILWIVWDTVRRDHVSLYGYDTPTTPFLDEWARQARVYTNCVSPGSTTVPSHASMFTGLLPSEHGASNEHPQLDSQFDTIAELLKGGGYDTYMFAANPHLSRSHKFTQGFDQTEHPWSDAWKQQAVEIIKSKLDPRDQSSEMVRKMNSGRINDWTIKTAGALAQQGVQQWLDQRTDGDKPYFVFLNYMEAHRPLIPGMEYRRKMMSEEQILKSFKVDRTWPKTWAYTFGQAEYTDEELELTGRTYDAAVLELDDLFRDLITGLEAKGALDNTIVILTSDHGEHLGEHHMLDHQYSLYDVLLEVPLIVHYPKAFEPGRDDRPVMSFDVFPTLLNLAGLSDAVAGIPAIDLREVPEARLRLSEYPTATDGPFDGQVKAFADLEAERERWLRSLRALTDGDSKLICGSDGARMLFNTADDPGEQTNLVAADAAAWTEPCTRLDGLLQTLTPRGARESRARLSPEEQARLESLGYAGGSEEEDEGGGIENYCGCD